MMNNRLPREAILQGARRLQALHSTLPRIAGESSASRGGQEQATTVVTTGTDEPESVLVYRAHDGTEVEVYMDTTMEGATDWTATIIHTYKEETAPGRYENRKSRSKFRVPKAPSYTSNYSLSSRFTVDAQHARDFFVNCYPINGQMSFILAHSNSMRDALSMNLAEAEASLASINPTSWRERLRAAGVSGATTRPIPGRMQEGQFDLESQTGTMTTKTSRKESIPAARQRVEAARDKLRAISTDIQDHEDLLCKVLRAWSYDQTYKGATELVRLYGNLQEHMSKWGLWTPGNANSDNSQQG